MIRACDEVKYIEPYFEYVAVKPFEHNSSADDNAPVAWGGGIVFSSDRSADRKIKVNILEEKSGWTGRDYLDIYFSKKKEDGTFSTPKQFSGKLSELNKNSGNTSFSLNGSEVFFTRNDNVLNKQKTYNLQLFHARKEGGKWKEVTKLPFCSPSYNFMHPAISPDGKMLFFATNKGGGQGGTDIWVSIREGEGKWSKPDNLGPTINTSANEGFPFMDNYGRLYFCSKGHIGYGGFDIFFTEMTGAGIWKKPVNLGLPINSPLDDISVYIDGEHQAGMFSSSRNGGDDDIFLFEVLDSSPPVLAVEEVEAVDEPVIEMPAEKVMIEDETLLVETIDGKEEIPGVEEKHLEATQLELIGHDIIDEATEEKAILEKDPSSPFEETSAETTLPKPAPLVFEEKKVIEALAEEQPEVKETSYNEENSINENLPQEEPVVLEEGQAVDNPEMTPPELNDMKTEIPPSAGEPLVKKATVVSLASFNSFLERAPLGQLEEGECFRVDNAIFDPNIWQLTPRVSKQLDEIVALLQRYPALKIELSAHTDSIGSEKNNQNLSDERVKMAIEYIVREGISPERISGVGHGESRLLNHCVNDVPCTQEEHLFNQRLELKILSWGQGQ